MVVLLVLLLLLILVVFVAIGMAHLGLIGFVIHINRKRDTIVIIFRTIRWSVLFTTVFVQRFISSCCGIPCRY